MQRDPAAHFNFGEDGDGRRSVTYRSGDSEKLMLTEVGSDLYRLEESSFAGDAVYGDTIRAERSSDGVLIFREIAQRSPLVTQSWILSADVFASESIKQILAAVINAGGMWEQAFGGLLMIHAPDSIAQTTFDEIARRAKIQAS
jgi:hypothetical protein